MTTRMIPLTELKFGHEASPPINARKTWRDAEIDELAASISAHGQIQELKVRSIDGQLYVIDGNRRLAAHRLRVERDEIAANTRVKCDEDNGATDAEEISLAANIMRLPLHQADMYEAFRDLAEHGLTEDAIASRFGVEVKRVKKFLALGRLAPVILQAWRDDVFTRDAVDCVRAFTLAKSVKEQERVFLKLEKTGHLQDWNIRKEFGADDRTASKWVKIVGLESYVAAGGKVIEDLFGDNHVISDGALAAQLGAQKMEAEVERLKADGWSWASLGSDLPQGWNYSWTKLQPNAGVPTKEEKKRLKALNKILDAIDENAEATEEEVEAEQELQRIEATIAARSWSIDQMAKAGAAVELGFNGLEIIYGLVKPGASKREKPVKHDAPSPKEQKEPAVSNALAVRLSQQASLAVRAAIGDEPRLGLVALLAGHLNGGMNGTPIRVRSDGYGGGMQEVQHFTETFERLAAMSNEELFKVAAGVAGKAVDVTVYSAEQKPFRGPNGTLAGALDPERLQAALVEAFDAADYFNGASKPLVLQAIRDAVNEDEARKAGALKKAELVAFAVENVAGTGWLPPELRASTYAGPSSASRDEPEASPPVAPAGRRKAAGDRSIARPAAVSEDA